VDWIGMLNFNQPVTEIELSSVCDLAGMRFCW